jgi:stage III sporulation protein AG
VQEADANGGTRTTTTSRNDVTTVYDSKESPYVVQEFSPVVKGILVVAEGGGNLSVKKQIQETIQALFGLDAHKISIMKMEVLK